MRASPAAPAIPVDTPPHLPAVVSRTMFSRSYGSTTRRPSLPTPAGRPRRLSPFRTSRRWNESQPCLHDQAACSVAECAHRVAPAFHAVPLPRDSRSLSALHIPALTPTSTQRRHEPAEPEPDLLWLQRRVASAVASLLLASSHRPQTQIPLAVRSSLQSKPRERPQLPVCPAAQKSGSSSCRHRTLTNLHARPSCPRAECLWPAAPLRSRENRT